MTKVAYMSFRTKLLVVQTDQKVRTKSLAKKFIKYLCQELKKSDKETKLYLSNEPTIQHIESQITLGFMEHVVTETGYNYMHIESNTRNEIMNYPMDDFYNDVIVLGCI